MQGCGGSVQRGLAWSQLAPLHQCSRSLGRWRHGHWRGGRAVQSDGLRWHRRRTSRLAAVAGPSPAAAGWWPWTRRCCTRLQPVAEPITGQWNGHRHDGGQPEDTRSRRRRRSTPRL